MVSILLVFGFEHWAYRGRVLRGVTVAGVELSGFSRTEAVARIAAVGAERSRVHVEIAVGARRFRLDPRLVGFAIDAPRTADRALERGRPSGIVEKFRSWLERFAVRDDEPARGRLDRALLAELVSGWEAEAIAERPFEGGVRLDGPRVLLERPRAGQSVDVNVAERRILDALLAARTGRVVELSTVRVTPRLTEAEVERAARDARRFLAGPVELSTRDGSKKLRILAEEIASALEIASQGERLSVRPSAALLERVLAGRLAELETPPKDARFVVDVRDRVSIEPSEPGIAVDRSRLIDALSSAVLGDARSGELVLTLGAKPALSTEAAAALGIKGLVRSFTTRHECCQKRVQNIHRIADIVDGTLVRPGETVSVNALVGPRTEKNGFVPAPTIEEGEMVDTPGGGVSQFATTLFNALFHGGYEIIERQPHSYWFSRYPMGHEATLSWPKPDIVFQNDTEAGLLIKTAYTDTSITVKLYGDNGGRKVRAEVSPRKDIVDPPVELIPNPKLAPDREKVKEAGMIGWSVMVARIRIFADGTSKEERRKVTYKPRVRRVEVHPCRIPKGEPGHTGERCPEPEDVELEVENAAPDDTP
jgi:vancomycin resistance protein YoaR